MNISGALDYFFSFKETPFPLHCMTDIPKGIVTWYLYAERKVLEDGEIVVPDKTAKIIKEFLKKKGINTSNCQFIIKRPQSNKIYSMLGSAVDDLFRIFVPSAAVKRIQKAGKLTKDDKFSILHEYGHYIYNDNAFDTSILQKSIFRLGLYCLSRKVLTDVCSVPPLVSTLISVCFDRAIGILFDNTRNQETQYNRELRADAYAASFSRQDLQNGIKFFQKLQKKDKALGVVESEEAEPVCPNLMEFHPSHAARIAALKKLSSK